MAIEISYNEPTQFNSGETVAWKKSDLTDFPQADGWTPKYTITGSGGNATIVGQFANGEWTFTLAAANNTLQPGDYHLYGFVTKGEGANEESYQIYAPTFLTVFQNYKTASTTDIRSHAEIMVSKLETFLERIAQNPVHSETIAGRAYARNNILEAKQLLNQYRAEVRQQQLSEQIANGEGGGEILTTFENELN